MFVTDTPMIHEIGYKTYLIDCFGMGTPILYVGEKKALLVDCGSGNCDMRGIAERIAKVPVELALTHEHADHVGCIVQWEKVYAPALEIGDIQTLDGAFMQKFLDFFNGVLVGEDGLIGPFVPQRTMIPWERMPEFVPLYDGDRFDLGGRTITVYRCQVHSKGSLVYVDDRTRTLYAGDSISNDTGPATNPINLPTIVSLEDEIRGLENVLKHEEEYDTVWSGHAEWGGAGLEFWHSFDRDVVRRMLDVGKRILAGKVSIHKESGSHGSRSYAAVGPTTLYFLEEYMHDEDLPEQYRYVDPGRTKRKEPVCQ